MDDNSRGYVEELLEELFERDGQVLGSEGYQSVNSMVIRTLDQSRAERAAESGGAPFLLYYNVSADLHTALTQICGGDRVLSLGFSKVPCQDVEAFRDAVVHRWFRRMGDAMRIVHVGGFVDQHAPWGRFPFLHTGDPTCRQESQEGASGAPLPVGIASAIARRGTHLGSLAGRRAHLERDDLRSGIDWSSLELGMTGDFNLSAYDAPDVDTMYIDLNICPLSQEQVGAMMAAAGVKLCSGHMFWHDFETETGTCSVPGFQVRYTEADGLLVYGSRAGEPEFMNQPLINAQQWQRRMAFVWKGNTYTVQLGERLGPFRMFDIHFQEGLHVTEIFHAEWQEEERDQLVVDLQRLISPVHNAGSSMSYVFTRTKVPMREYRNSCMHALRTRGGELNRSVVNAYVSAQFSRAVVYGTSVKVKPYERFALRNAMVSAVLWTIRSMRRNLGDAFVAIADTLKGSMSFSDLPFYQQVGGWLSSTLATVYTQIYRHLTPFPMLASAAASARLVRLAGPKAEVRMQPRFRLLRSHVGGSQDVLSEYVRVLPGFMGAAVTAAYGALYRGLPLVPRKVTSNVDRAYQAAVAKVTQEAAVRVVEIDFEEEDIALKPVSRLEGPVERQQLFEKVVNRSDVPLPELSNRGNYGRIDTRLEVTDGHLPNRDMSIGDALNVANSVYRDLFPNNANTDFSYEQDLLHSSEFREVLNPISFRVSTDEDFPSSRRVRYSKTLAPNRPSAQQTARNMISALRKRNLDTTYMQAPVDHAAMADLMWDALKRNRFRDKPDEHIANLRAEPISAAFPEFVELFQRLTPSELVTVNLELDWLEDMFETLTLDEFTCMFKGDVKPVMSDAAAEAMQKFQTLMFYKDKRLKLCWGLWIKDLTKRFESCLAPQHLFTVRGDPMRQEEHLSKYFPYGEKGVVIIEDDLSACDQGALLTSVGVDSFEHKCHLELGLDPQRAWEWSSAHERTAFRTMNFGMSGGILAQRKSGDFTTLEGNTRTTAAQRSMVLPRPIFSSEGGDDGIAAYHAEGLPLLESIPESFAHLFNGTLMVSAWDVDAPDVQIYGYSHFFVVDEVAKHVYRVADPVKTYEQLGRGATVDARIMQERRKSFLERVELFSRPFPFADYERQVRARYRKPDMDVEGLVKALVTISKSERLYDEAWHKEFVSENAHGIVR